MTGAPLRAPVLWATGLGPVRRFVTGSRLGRRVALRFVAGERLEEGMAAARALDRQGIRAMLDHLGENVASAEQASGAADGYYRDWNFDARLPTDSIPASSLTEKILGRFADEARRDPELLRTAPHTTPVGRLDETAAARNPVLHW